jgi:hypothetical protein
MSETEAGSVRTPRGSSDQLDRKTHHVPWTPAQWYCLAAGLVLLLAGAFGFMSDSTFDVGSALNGKSFLGFEVNGWHNVVHVLSGLLLLSAFRRRSLAKTVALAFGLIYAADNILHIALSALGIATGLVSRGSYDRDRVLVGDRAAGDRDAGGRFTRETGEDAAAQRQQRQHR